MECPICGNHCNDGDRNCPVCGYEFNKADKINYKQALRKVVDEDGEDAVENGTEDMPESIDVNEAKTEKIKFPLIPVILVILVICSISSAIVVIKMVKKDNHRQEEVVSEENEPEKMVGDEEAVFEEREPEREKRADENVSIDSFSKKDNEASVDDKLTDFNPETEDNSNDIEDMDPERIIFPEEENVVDDDRESRRMIERLIMKSRRETLTEGDLRDCTLFELSAVRNGIYASAGYALKTEEWNTYFKENFSWYRLDPSVKMEDLDEVSIKNAAFIKNYEDTYKSGSNSFDSDTSTTLFRNSIDYLTCSSFLYWEGKEYPPEQMVDYLPETAWMEGADGYGRGESVTITYDAKYHINGMEIYNGYHKSEELYYENGRPKKLLLEFDDGNAYTVTLDDVYGSREIRFGQSYYTKNVTITILDVYEGTKYEDTAISEVLFFAEDGN